MTAVHRANLKFLPTAANPRPGGPGVAPYSAITPQRFATSKCHNATCTCSAPFPVRSPSPLPYRVDEAVLHRLVRREVPRALEVRRDLLLRLLGAGGQVLGLRNTETSTRRDGQFTRRSSNVHLAHATFSDALVASCPRSTCPSRTPVTGPCASQAPRPGASLAPRPPSRPGQAPPWSGSSPA